LIPAELNSVKTSTFHHENGTFFNRIDLVGKNSTSYARNKNVEIKDAYPIDPDESIIGISGSYFV
jgi:hypothetical protein